MPNSGINIYEYKTPDIKPQQIARLVFSVMVLMLITIAYQTLKGMPIVITIGALSLCTCIMGVAIYFTLRRSSTASITLNWDSKSLVFTNSFTKKAVITIGTAPHVERPMSEVVRMDTRKDNGHKFATVTFDNGTAIFSDCYTGYDELVEHLTRIVIENDHPKSCATTTELEWRFCGILLAIAVPILIIMVALSIWFVTQ